MSVGQPLDKQTIDNTIANFGMQLNNPVHPDCQIHATLAAKIFGSESGRTLLCISRYAGVIGVL